jgi:hypothetical protein
MAESGTSLPSRLMPSRSAESVADRLSEGVVRSTVRPVLSVATRANERRDFFTSGSFKLPDLRELSGGLAAFRLVGKLCVGVDHERLLR